jgi:hypothetical protein
MQQIQVHAKACWHSQVCVSVSAGRNDPCATEILNDGVLHLTGSDSFLAARAVVPSALAFRDRAATSESL